MARSLNDLIRVNRYSGIELLKPESVSDHIWGMITLALTHINKINQDRIKLSLPTVDLKELIYKISIHDLDEAFSLDIPRPFKYYNNEIHEVIDRTANQILKDKIGKELYTDVQTAKDSSIEGSYVRYFDIIQAGLKMADEIKLGNSFMHEELPNVIESIEGFIGDIANQSWSVIEIHFLNYYLSLFKNILDAE